MAAYRVVIWCAPAHAAALMAAPVVVVRDVLGGTARRWRSPATGIRSEFTINTLPAEGR